VQTPLVDIAVRPPHAIATVFGDNKQVADLTACQGWPTIPWIAAMSHSSEPAIRHGNPCVLALLNTESRLRKSYLQGNIP
jgi:hypothetical protein